MLNEPAEILDFWLGEDRSLAAFAAHQERWYKTDPKLDAEIARRFGETLEAAEAGKLDHWAEDDEGAVALLVLLDQFTRNLHRGTADAWRNDAAALKLARRLLDESRFEKLDVPSQVLCFHPFHHSEAQENQALSVKLYEGLLATADPEWHELIAGHLEFARSHAGTVAKFGRFPHRNETLGRENTAEERTFLQEDSRSYGQ